MDDTEFSAGERVLLSLIGFVFLALVGGLIFAPEIFWDDFVKIYIWDPIVKDAGESGDAGYSQVNTIVYILTMVAAVIAFQALFRNGSCQSMTIWFGLSCRGLFSHLC